MEFEIPRKDGPEIGRQSLNSRSKYNSYWRSRHRIRSTHTISTEDYAMVSGPHTKSDANIYQVVYRQDTRMSRDRYTASYFEYDMFVRGNEGVKWPPVL
jgi:hypothetical protein